MLGVSYWINRLEDPFEMFAMQEITPSLAKLASQSEKSIFERAGWWGVSSKYYSVADEHDSLLCIDPVRPEFLVNADQKLIPMTFL
jgi:hypothetical protein